MNNLHLYKLLLLFTASMLSYYVNAQTPTSYYRSADGEKGAALKTAMHGIINSHTTVSYDGLLDLYHTTDKRVDGLLWDMYSDNTNYVIGGPNENKQYKKEGDSYNREHSVPQSWFNSASPMKSDAFHVVPTDGYVNNRRSNYPYGEVGTATYSSHNSFSKLGNCTTTGYTGTVFEPNDEYKGDFARIYFYMVTCYENRCTSWGGIFSNSKYPGMDSWQLKMLLRWAQQDPVSQKEIDRNNAVYAKQKNRNPFVDYPGLEQYVWGDNVNIAFSYDDYVVPTGYGEWKGDGSSGNDGDNGGDNGGGNSGGNEGGSGDTPGNPTEGGTQYTEGAYILVTDASQLSQGDNIVIVCASDKVALSTTQNDNNRGQVAVTITNNEIASLPSSAQVFKLEGSTGAWYLNTGSGYLYAGSSSSNQLKTETTADDNAKAAITFNNSGAVIKFQGKNTRNLLQHNTSAKIFSCYSSGQHTVQIYKQLVSTEINHPHFFINYDADAFYNLSGQRVDRSYKGVVIHNGRKYIQR